MHALSILKTNRTLEIQIKISSFVAAIFLLVLSPLAPAETIKATLAKMTTEQKVGQLMIWSFDQTELTPDLSDFLTKYQPGALIVFRRNIKSHPQIAKLNGDLQHLAAKHMRAPLFLMVDQEGGVVTRVRVSTPIPSALALGKAEDASFIEPFAKTQADLLQALGFNVNLAPVLDLSNSEKESFIGNRTFGDNPESVAKLGVAYARGMSEGGILPTAKHFPGHGGTIQDSHKGVAKKLANNDELESRDLVPFQEFAGAHFPRAIMMAHLELPNVDPSGLPATYSKVLIQDELRRRMNYQGIILTDDLEMGGASITSDVGERGVKAFIAGNDMLMFAGSATHQRRAFQALLTAVENGRISKARLNESVMRILEAKMQLHIAASQIDPRKARSAIKRLEGFSREVMHKNFQLALENKKSWPAIDQETHVEVFTSSPGFYRSFKEVFPGKTRLYGLTPQSLSGVASELERPSVNFGIFYASGTTTAHFLRRLTPQIRAKLIVINCNHAGAVDNQDSFLSVLNLNSHSPESGEWLAQVLAQPPQESPLIPEAPEVDLRAPAGDSD